MSLHDIKGLRGRQMRRPLLRNTTTALSGAAALTMAPAVLGAQSRAAKIGLVTPATGPLAAFAEADAFAVGQFKKTVAGGIKIGATHMRSTCSCAISNQIPIALPRSRAN